MMGRNNQKKAEFMRYSSIMEIIDEARLQIAKQQRR